MTILLSRRRLVAGLVGLVAAPAVVRAASLMPVRSFVWDLSTPAGELAFYNDVVLKRQSDLLYSAVQEMYEFVAWPRTSVGVIRHRRDLADVGEPYLSQILAYREMMGVATNG